MRSGRPVVLTRVYNKADEGELTGSLRITPDTSAGMVIIFEGGSTTHLLKPEEYCLCVLADPELRHQRGMQRSSAWNEDEFTKRFKLIRAFEEDYFERYGDGINKIVDTTNGEFRELAPLLDPSIDSMEQGTLRRKL